MESIEVELGDFTLRRGSLLLSHTRAGLARGLEPGEQVVLHDRARGCWTARVADLDFELTDTVYRIQIGSPVSAQEARERVLGRTWHAGAGSSPFGLPG